jgi:hypothetical protein
MARAREWLVNLAVSAGSIVVFALLCEFVVFRFIWVASDVPANDFVNEVVRYAPDQRGVWRVRDEIAAPYAVNAQGWNSGHGAYARLRAPGTERIAFVGDSFVEGMQVAHDRNFGDLVASQRPGPAEAYRFGIAGAPMSQYLHMIEREVAAYRPDWIVVLLISNDFDESFQFKQGRYTSSFRKLRVEDGRVLGEVPPSSWRPGPAEWLRRTATARFLLYRWQVRPQAIVDFFLPTARAEGRFAANVEIGAVLAQEEDVAAATDYLIARIRARAGEIGAKLLIAMDGDRASIYAGQESSPALALNRIAAEAAARHKVEFLDLHPVFAADWRANRQRFDFESDAHWNERGHAVAARAIANTMSAMGPAAGR